MHDLVLVVVVRRSYTLQELHLGRSFLRRSRLSYVRASVRRPSALLSGSPRRAGRDAAAAGRSTNRASNLWREGGSGAAAAAAVCVAGRQLRWWFCSGADQCKQLRLPSIFRPDMYLAGIVPPIVLGINIVANSTSGEAKRCMCEKMENRLILVIQLCSHFSWMSPQSHPTSMSIPIKRNLSQSWGFVEPSLNCWSERVRSHVPPPPPPIPRQLQIDSKCNVEESEEETANVGEPSSASGSAVATAATLVGWLVCHVESTSTRE